MFRVNLFPIMLYLAAMLVLLIHCQTQITPTLGIPTITQVSLSPTTPMNLVVEWDTIEQAESYEIIRYRYIEETLYMDILGTTTETMFEDTDAMCRLPYYYAIRAIQVSKYSKESEWYFAGEQFLKTMNITPPSVTPPTGQYNAANPVNTVKVDVSLIDCLQARYEMTTDGSEPRTPTKSSHQLESSGTVSGMNMNGITQIKIAYINTENLPVMIQNFVFLQDTTNPADPKLNRDAGYYNYTNSFTEVSIINREARCAIYYTISTDGSEPPDPTSSDQIVPDSGKISNLPTAGNLWIKLIQVDSFDNQSCISSYEYYQDISPPKVVNISQATYSCTDGAVHLSWNQPDEWVMVLKNDENSFTVPTIGQSYEVGDTIGTAQVLYMGTDSTFSDTCLYDGTYYYNLVAYDMGYNYTLGTIVQSVSHDVTPPDPIDMTMVSYNCTTSTMTIEWDVPTETIVIMQSTTGTIEPPESCSLPTAGDTIGSSTVVYVGTGNSYTITNPPDGTYSYQAFAYDAAHNRATGGIMLDETVWRASPDPISDFTGFYNNSYQTNDLSWTPTGDRVVILRSNSGATSPPSDGSSYKSGDVIGTSHVVYVGTDTEFYDGGMCAGQTYSYKIYSLNTCSMTYSTPSTPLTINYTTGKRIYWYAESDTYNGFDGTSNPFAPTTTLTGSSCHDVVQSSGSTSVTPDSSTYPILVIADNGPLFDLSTYSGKMVITTGDAISTFMYALSGNNQKNVYWEANTGSSLQWDEPSWWSDQTCVIDSPQIKYSDFASASFYTNRNNNLLRGYTNSATHDAVGWYEIDTTGGNHWEWIHIGPLGNGQADDVSKIIKYVLDMADLR